MILKLIKQNDESLEEAKAVAQDIANFLRVSIEVDACPYGFVIKPDNLPLVQKRQPDGCDCGGVGGHSDWCKTKRIMIVE